MIKNSLSVLTVPKSLFKSEFHALRRKSIPVDLLSMPSDELESIIQNMVYFCMADCGVSIAAPQIGIFLRMIYVGDIGGKLKNSVLFNPEIIEASETLEEDFESCLSVPNLRGVVRRHANIKIRYQDQLGEEKTTELSGFAARVIQHELDHLDGILYVDKVDGDLETTEDLFWLMAENRISKMKGKNMGS